MSNTFRTSRRVEFRDTDAAGIMHFSAILVVMEQSEHEFLRHLGLPLFQGTDQGELSWPRISCSAEFKSPARFEDLIEVAVSVSKLGRSSVTYRFELNCGDRAIAVGSMTSVHCLVRDDRIEPQPIPPETRSKLAAYE